MGGWADGRMGGWAGGRAGVNYGGVQGGGAAHQQRQELHVLKGAVHKPHEAICEVVLTPQDEQCHEYAARGWR